MQNITQTQPKRSLNARKNLGKTEKTTHILRETSKNYFKKTRTTCKQHLHAALRHSKLRCTDSHKQKKRCAHIEVAGEVVVNFSFTQAT